MNEPHMLYEVKDTVAWITINREKQRNAISVMAVNLFFEYLDKAQEDEAVRVVLITGAGDRAFCAGADLGSPMGGDNAGVKDVFANYAKLLKRITRFPKPTVARVNGSCVAGGTGFMLACDIVIATDRAKFGTP
ncbi:MAG: enoyl-CoA hydratase/isomerase family protein, partial [bacterium]|nr:enoyl-CoA hydratase/isomerase family protein [bacterium]